MNDNLFKKVEKKTNVNKSTILSLAEKLKSSNFKDDNVLNEVITELSTLTGREISNEKRSKIIKAIKNDKVPNDIENKW
ncbi:MAG: stage VI sporulation protein F [Bacilli bacterium]|nr:stage VI sporulation protein F [Bacilli bacterium]